MIKVLNDRIVADSEILSGVPSVKGTRVSVELIMDCLAAGWSRTTILENYPTLVDADISAAVAYARDLVARESTFTDAA